MRSFFAALVTCAVLLQGVHAMPAAALNVSPLFLPLLTGRSCRYIVGSR